MSGLYELVRALALFAALAVLAHAASRYVAERWRGRQAGRRLELLEVLPLGPRRQLCLVRVGEEEVLCLGLGAEGVAPLARYRGAAARRLLGADGEGAGRG